MWRCTNDMFGYCSGEPEWLREPQETGASGYKASGSCSLDPKACGRYQTLSQQLEGKSLPKVHYKVGKGGRLIKVKDD